MAVGAIDGCHFPISALEEFKTDYRNYKEFFSVVSLAVCDASYKVYYVKSGIPGRTNDAGGFKQTEIYRLAKNGLLLPPDTLKFGDVDVGYHFLGDGAFALKPWLMKPYPFLSSVQPDRRCFNKHHSRARRVIENVFGRLKARWRRLLNHFTVRLEDAGKIVQVAFALNNICEERNVPFNQQWISDSQPLNPGLENQVNSNANACEQAEEMREALKL